MNVYKAAIFDLDGVIADTARLHLAAWQQLAEEEGFTVPADADERLKGVDRMASLNIVLEGASRHYGDAEKNALADRKNQRYQQLVTQLTPADLLPGAQELLEQLDRWQIPMALASASKNARAVIEGLGIAERFAYIADAARVKHPKPDPEIFLLAARGLGMEPHLCVGIEDAAAGITAIKRAGMYAVGIGDAKVLADADQCAQSLAEFRPASCFRPGS